MGRLLGSAQRSWSGCIGRSATFSLTNTIGGCGVSSGGIIATGTASGTTPDSLGCLLEMTMGGRKAFELNGGLKRTWLEDGDSVRITGFAGTEADGVGVGECIGKVVAAHMLKG